MNKIQVLFACLVGMSASVAAQTDYSMIPYRTGAKWGFATADKHVTVAPKYSEVSWFNNGYAAVKVGNKWGYINQSGKLVIPAKYTVAKPFRKGYMPNNKGGGDSVLFAGASLVASGYEICINTKGQRMPKCPAIPENSVAENRIPVASISTQKNYSLPNSAGLFDKVVDDYKLPGNDETYYVAVKNNMYGVINSKFETVLPYEYNNLTVVRTGSTPYLQAAKNNMYGVLNGTGQVMIAPDYAKINTFKGIDGNEYVIVQKDGKSYVKDINNKDIISQGYSNIVYDDASGGFIVTGDDNMQGYYYMDNTMIKPRYKEVKSINGTRYLMVRTNSGKWGYISDKGDEYFTE